MEMLVDAMSRGRPRKFDESQVLDQAMRFFWRHGYRQSGMTALLESMGLGRQSFYDTFGSKKQLYMRAIEHYRSTQLISVLEILGGLETPLENVREAVGFFEKLALDGDMRGCFVANALLECEPEDAEIKNLLTETLDMLETGYRKALEHAQSRGDLAAGKSPKAIARALTNASLGLAVTGRLGKDRESVADIYEGTLLLLE